MIGIANVDLYAPRGVPFVDVTDFVGQNYDGATFRMEVRPFRDAPTLAFALDQQANPAAQGISVAVRTENGLPVSAVQIRVNETTIEALQFSSPRGGNVVLQYALDITGGGFGKHRRMQGSFIVEASANG